MAKSLRNKTTNYEHHYSFVKSALSNAAMQEKVIILVEGDDDLPVYEPLFISSRVVIKPAPEDNGVRGCTYVEKVTNNIIAEKPNARLIGVRDADYTPWVPYEVHSNVFRTEERDMEMMLLRSENVRRDLDLVENGATEKFEWIKEHIGIPRGQMRLLNEVLNLQCSFKERARISNLWNNKTLKPNWATLLTTDFIHNCVGLYRNRRFQSSDFDREVATKRLAEIPWYKICQGHDVMSALQYQMVDTAINVDTIMEQMIKSYRVSDFHVTELYNKLLQFSQEREWQILK